MVLLLVSAIIIVLVILSSHGPQLNEEYVKGVVEEARGKYNIPAVSVSVMDSSRILYTVYEGVRVDSTTENITDADYFHIGSCSKSVLAYIAARLVEKGAISRETKFFDLYSELKANALVDYPDITLVDLLSCRAGIQPYTSGTEAYPDLSAFKNQMLGFTEYLLKQAPFSNRNDSGGFDFLYSNASFTIATIMLEKASNFTYQELLDQYIVKELGIDVFVGWPYEISRDEPWGHYWNTDNTLIIIGPNSDYKLNPLITSSGNLSMKATDFTKYIQIHLKGLIGGYSSLRKEDYAYIDQKYDGFSLGAWNEKLLGKSYICFDGTAGTYFTRGIIIPGSDFGFTILINNGSEDAVDYITMKLAKAQHNLWWMFWI